MALNSNIPDGPVQQQWDNLRAELKLVNPANKRKYTVIVVGTGLAGSSAAATFAELGYNVSAFTYHDSARRAHSIAAQGGSAAQMAGALEAGLAEAPDAAAVATEPPTLRELAVPEVVLREVVREVEVLREVPGAAVPTMVIDKPLRSGQRVYARGGDLVVLAVVSFGAEVIADGNIHVYGPLRGRAIAGARGNTEARIFSTCMEPQLVSIACIYRTTEQPLAANVLGQLAQVRLAGEKILVEPLAA